VLLLGGVAGAAGWILLANGSGSGSTTTGTAGPAPAVVVGVGNAPAGLTPGGSVPIYWNSLNSSGSTEQLDAITVAVTSDSNETACPLSNFTITAGQATDAFGVVSLPAFQWPTTDRIGDDSSQGDMSLVAGGSPWELNMIPTAANGCQDITVSYSVTLS
jgi:hypothetical protein